MADRDHTPLLHLVGARDWALDGDRYAPASLDEDGFVHLSAPHQLHRVAGARFAGRDDLLLLVVDPACLDVPVVWEDTTGEGEDFPHAYGSLPRAAVVAVHAYAAGADGRFPPPWEVSDMVPSPDGTPTEAPGTLRFLDVSRAGHVLGHGRLTGLPPTVALGELLRRRVTAEAEAANAAPSRTVTGLVQPHDAVRHSDGFRRPAAGHLDVGAHVSAAVAALEVGLVSARAGDRTWIGAETEVPVADLDELTIVLQRPIVAAP